jgi:hypothetical protein
VHELIEFSIAGSASTATTSTDTSSSDTATGTDTATDTAAGTNTATDTTTDTNTDSAADMKLRIRTIMARKPLPSVVAAATTGAAIVTGTTTTNGAAAATSASAAVTTGIDSFDDSPDDSDYQSLEALATAAAEDQAPNDEGFSYVQVMDTTGNYLLYNDDDGNLFLDSVIGAEDGVTYSTSDGMVVSDDSQRVFHLYTDTIDAFGVSRFRISGNDSIPKSTDLVTLVPINYDDSSATPNVYLAADSEGNLYYTVICDFIDAPSKLFLAVDPDAGPTKLADPGLIYILTGGAVTSCQVIFFATTSAGISA